MKTLLSQKVLIPEYLMLMNILHFSGLQVLNSVFYNTEPDFGDY